MVKASDGNRTRDYSLEGCRFTTKLHSREWTLLDSNQRPDGYEPSALTNWAKGPEALQLSAIYFYLIVKREN